MRKKCNSCEGKIESKFEFCPYCGNSLKKNKDKKNFGMLGRNDTITKTSEEVKLPFGMEKMVGSLIKQLEKQMGTANFEDIQGMPKGIKFKITRGTPQMGQMIQEKPKIHEEISKVSDKELKRRMKLPKVDVESKVRRLADTITYEMETPGVKKKEDVVLTKLATGLEMKAYSNNKCYVKFIPLKIEVIEYYVREEKVFVELKG